MAKILTFPERQLTSASDQRVDGASDLVVFDADGALSFSQATSNDAEQSLVRPGVSLDWTNQELASIYRVKHLLDAAQIPTELDRGVSDEGDPWCVFCTVEGDVFIHLSRIDGLYWLDSQKLQSPLNGSSFDELVHGFVDLSEQGRQLTEDSKKIVRFQKSNSVFLHPSVMLAALVWSLYFGSNELLIPNGPASNDHGLEKDSPKPWYDDLEETLAENSHDISIKEIEKSTLVEAQSQDADKLTGSSGSSFPFSMTLGLGTIAVASGLILESDWKDIMLSLLAGREDEEFQLGTVDGEATGSVASLLIQSFDLIASFVASNEGAEDVISDDVDPASFEAASLADAANVLIKISELGVLLDGALSTSEGVLPQEEKVELDIPAEGLQEYEVLADLANPQKVVDLSLENLADVAQSDILLGLIGHIFGETSLNIVNNVGTIYSINHSQSYVVAQDAEILEDVIFDIKAEEISDIISSNQSNFVPESSVEDKWHEENALPLLDREVREAIFDLWQSSESIQFVLTERDLVFFDINVYNSGVDRVQMSWDTGDGGTVTVVGTETDFIDFGFA